MWFREAQKKVLLLMARPLRPNPPPLELDGRWNVIVGKKKVPKKFFLFMARPFNPHPLLMARPLRGERFLRSTQVAEEFIFR